MYQIQNRFIYRPSISGGNRFIRRQRPLAALAGAVLLQRLPCDARLILQ